MVSVNDQIIPYITLYDVICPLPAISIKIIIDPINNKFTNM